MMRRLPAVAGSLGQPMPYKGKRPADRATQHARCGHPKSAQELVPKAAARVGVIARLDRAIQ